MWLSKRIIMKLINCLNMAADACFGSKKSKCLTEGDVWTIKNSKKMMGFPGCIGEVHGPGLKLENDTVRWKDL